MSDESPEKFPADRLNSAVVELSALGIWIIHHLQFPSAEAKPVMIIWSKLPSRHRRCAKHLLVILMTSALTAVSASANAGCEPNPGCPADPTGRFCGPTLEEMQREARAKQYPGASIGMTTDQVRNETAWGQPCSVNRTVTANGEREQWVYPDYQYLYFENGRLVSIETKGSH